MEGFNCLCNKHMMFCSSTLSLITSAVFTESLTTLHHMLATWQEVPFFLQLDTDNHLVCLGLQPALRKDSRILKGVGVS